MVAVTDQEARYSKLAQVIASLVKQAARTASL